MHHIVGNQDDDGEEKWAGGTADGIRVPWLKRYCEVDWGNVVALNADMCMGQCVPLKF